MASGLEIGRIALLAIALGAAPAAMAAPKPKPSKSFAIDADPSAFARGVVGLKKGGAMFAFGEGRDVLVRPVDDKGKPKNPVSITVTGQSEFGIAEAELALLANGNVAAAWIGRPDGKSATLIRVLRPDGTNTSGEVTVSEANSDTRSDVSVSALSGGGFVVGWLDNGFSGGSTVRARVFSASAVPQGFVGSLVAPSGVRHSAPHVAALGAGFVMVYASSGAVEGVYAQLYSATAKPSGKPFRLDKANKLAHQQPIVTPLAGGGAAVVWRENDISEAGSLPIVVDTKLKGLFLDKKGKPGKSFALDDKIVAKSIENSLSLADTDAGLLVAWSVRVGQNDVDVRGALVSSSGKAGPVTTLTKSDKDSESGPHVAVMKDGRVTLGYSARENKTGGSALGAFGAYIDVTGK